MPKHKLFKSFLGDYIDSDKDEELRRNKAESDEKVLKILNYLKEKEDDSGRPLAADLVEDVHSYYNSLYSHYLRMTDELMKEADISSSSSSDDNGSPRKKGNKNGKITSNFNQDAAVARIKDLEMQLHSSHNCIRELEKQRDDELQKKLNKQEEDPLSPANDVTEENKSLSLHQKALENKISELEKSIEDSEHEMSSVPTSSEHARNDASNQISAMEEKIKSLQREVEVQQLIKVAWEDQCKKLEVQLQNHQEDQKSLEQNVDAIKQQFQREIDAKDKEVSKLEDTIEDLRQELEMKIDEINTLVENMRTTEVKQRLTSQKLRITEQLLGETDESRRLRVDKLLEERKLLEEKNAKLVREVAEKVQDTLAQFDTLAVKIEKDCAHLECHVYEIMNEIRVVIKWISETNAEKDQLEKENDVLVEQLKDGKEQALLLTTKIEELETTWCKNTDETNRLILSVKEHEEKIKKLEKTIQERDEKLVNLERHVKEKDDGIMTLSEEKREAIRQLCMWVDYHQNRYNDLRDMLIRKCGRRHI